MSEIYSFHKLGAKLTSKFWGYLGKKHVKLYNELKEILKVEVS